MVEDWTDRHMHVRTLREFKRVLSEDLAQSCMNVAKLRAVITAIEGISPSMKPTNDSALKRLRAYGLNAEVPWKAERSIALDMAELVEDMEASKQSGAVDRLQYRVVLMDLVTEKLDMDRVSSIIEAVDSASPKDSDALLKQLQDGISRGSSEGVKEALHQAQLLAADPLGAYKAYANIELDVKRFVRPAERHD